MNSKYTYLNGNVILQDREGNEYETPNTDNMYDVVKQENYVEIIDNEIDDVQDEIVEAFEGEKKYKALSKISLLIGFLFPVVLSLFVRVIYLPLDLEMKNQFIVKIMNIFNLQSFATYLAIGAFMASAILCYPIGILMSIVNHFERKWFKKHQIGKKKELKYLKAKKEEAEIALEELKSKSKEISIGEQFQERKIIIEVDNDLDYETLNQEQTNAYNTGIEEDKALSRVRAKRNRKY